MPATIASRCSGFVLGGLLLALAAPAPAANYLFYLEGQGVAGYSSAADEAIF